MDNLDLELNSDQLLRIIDNCWDSVLIIERNSKIRYVNNAFLMIVGYPRDKVIGAPFDLFLKNKYQEPFEKVVNKVQSINVQSFINVICETKDNHEVGLHIGMQMLLGSELVVLNIKQTQEPLLKEHMKEINANRIEALKRSPKGSGDKKDDNFFGKTLGWLDEANKAIDSMFNQEDKKKAKLNSKSKATTRTKRTSSSQSLSWLPKGVDALLKDEIKELVKEDLDTFVSINYFAHSQEEMIAAKEWHTWQVTIMLKLYKSGERLFIPEKEKAFPESVQKLSRHSLEQVIANMIKNVKKKANINAKKEILQKDAKWSAFEVACLLYFMLE